MVSKSRFGKTEVHEAGWLQAPRQRLGSQRLRLPEQGGLPNSGAERDLKGSFKGDIDMDIDVEVDVDTDSHFGCLEGVSK